MKGFNKFLSKPPSKAADSSFEWEEGEDRSREETKEMAEEIKAEVEEAEFRAEERMHERALFLKMDIPMKTWIV